NANAFAVLDDFGQAQANRPAAEGLFFEDTRYLSRLALAVNGVRPLLLSTTVTDGNTQLAVDLTNPEIAETGDRRLAASTVHIGPVVVLGEDSLFAETTLRNYGSEAAELEFTVELDADFIDLFEVRGMQRQQRGTLLPVAPERDGPVFAYRGLDGITRR